MTKVYNTINKKLIGLFILLSLFGCGGESLSTSPTKDTLQSPTSISLAKQVDNVKGYIGSLSDKNEPAFLALGVDNGEEDLSKRFNSSYIFLNDHHQHPSDKRSLAVNFNDLEQLQYLATKLPGSFDKIILDDSTWDATAWSKEHLVAFNKLLKSNGGFIFAPFFKNSGWLSDDKWKERFNNDEVPATKQALENHLIEQAISLSSKEKIISGGFFVPFDFRQQGRDLLSQLLSETIIPGNYIPILEGVFGKGNVRVAYNQPLPFYSRATKDPMKFLITATRTERVENTNDQLIK